MEGFSIISVSRLTILSISYRKIDKGRLKL